MSLDQLYKEIILEHNKSPRNFGCLNSPDITREGYNPLCGDRIEIQLSLTPDRAEIQECKFQGQGCSICLASASMMTEHIQGLTCNTASAAIESFRNMAKGESDDGKFADEDLAALAGVKKFPVRIKCALLPWTTLKDALDAGQNNEKEASDARRFSSTE